VIALESNRVALFDLLDQPPRVSPAFLPDCPQGDCAVAAVLGDGRIVHERSQRPRDPGSAALAGQTIEGLRTEYSIEEAGRARAVATIPMPTHHWVLQVRGAGIENAIALPPMFESYPLALAGEGHFAITSADRLEVQIFDVTGGLRRIVRLGITPRPISDEQARAIQAQNSSSATPIQHVDWPVAASWPPFEHMRFGANDDLWLWDYQHDLFASPGEPERITILAVDGSPVARLEVRADPLYADQSRAPDHVVAGSRDFLRVVTTDALGVDRLLAFPIVKD
jgi:hypothetical protein